MSDLPTYVTIAVGSGIFGWLGNMALEIVKSRGADRDADVRLETHRDELTFQLLEAARSEIKMLREEIHSLRPLQTHLLHFDEALMHVERLLVVPCESDNRGQIEREAKAFLKRVIGARRTEETQK